MITIKRIVNFETDENCYVVYNSDKNGFIIDPGIKADKIIKEAEKENLKISHILLTHCHYDHIEGLGELRKNLNLKVVSTYECNKNIQNPTVNLSALFSDKKEEEPADILVNDGDIIKISNMEIKVIKTPGHTDGSCCYLLEEDLFSGDTLFLLSVGRCDFPTGDEEKLKNSILNKIYTLDDEIIIHPGHGNDTKLYYEKRYNHYVKGN